MFYHKTQYLFHVTSEKSLNGIVSSQKLIPSGNLNKNEYDGFTYRTEDFSSIDNYTGEQFNGVYLGVKFASPVKQEISYYAPYCLIFSKELLKRRDYHFNCEDKNGRFYEKTFSSFKINSQEVDYEKQNEIIFHNEVSLDFLIGIFVQKISDISPVLKSLGKPIIVSNIYENISENISENVVEIKIPNFVFFPSPIEGNIFTNFGTSFITTEYIFDPDVYAAMILNCGYDYYSVNIDKPFIKNFFEKYIKGIKTFSKTFRQKLLQEIKSKYLINFDKTMSCPVPIIFPPFKREEVLDIIIKQ